MALDDDSAILTKFVSAHPDRALRRLQREQAPDRYVFLSERGAPMSAPLASAE
jgi:hypothetical protein